LSLTGFKGKKSKKGPKQQKDACEEKKVVVEKPTPELVISKNSVGYQSKKVDPASKWNIIELAEDITFEEHSDVIERHIEALFCDTEYFVPFFKEKINDKVVSLVLFEGYFFVRSNSDNVCPDKFRSEYIKGPMKKNRMIVEIPGVKINELKNELKLKLKERIPKRKQRVVPKIGVFSNLEGEVLSVDKKNLVAIVKFQYSTRIIEAPISFINLTIIS
jgi:hypothetical protein